MDKEFQSSFSSSDVLIVGDGDYSFSVAFFTRYNKFPLTLTASTLEQNDLMEQKYPDFIRNLEFLQSHDCRVITGVDATALNEHFKPQQFTHIIFNFPHIGGKSNIKKNRELLDNFLRSASLHITQCGAILVTLCKGQGGTDADNPKREWYNSWQIAAKAANSSLILTSVENFEGAVLFENYLSTGFRSQNKRFHTEGSLVHKFIRSETVAEPGTIFVNMQPDYYIYYMLGDALCRYWKCSQTTMEEGHTYSEYCQIYRRSSLELRIDAEGQKQLQSLHIKDRGQIQIHDSSIVWLVDTGELQKSDGEQIGHVEGDIITLDITRLITLLTDRGDARWFSSVNDFKIIDLTHQNNIITVTNHVPKSIYPPQYRFDISFWLGNDFTEDRFYRFLYEVSNHLVKEVIMIDTYTHPESLRASHCYGVIYQSLHQPLSYSMAYKYYQYLRQSVSQRLGVELR